MHVICFRLLHSKSKESDVQLKSILDESIRQRKAGLPINIPVPQVTASSSGSNVKEKEKNLDRLKRDLSQLVPGKSYGDTYAFTVFQFVFLGCASFI